MKMGKLLYELPPRSEVVHTLPQLSPLVKKISRGRARGVFGILERGRTEGAGGEKNARFLFRVIRG